MDRYRVRPLYLDDTIDPNRVFSLSQAVAIVTHAHRLMCGRSAAREEDSGDREAVERYAKYCTLSDKKGMYDLTTAFVKTPGVLLQPPNGYSIDKGRDFAEPTLEYVTLPDVRLLMSDGLSHYKWFFTYLATANRHRKTQKNQFPDASDSSGKKTVFVNGRDYDKEFADRVTRDYEKCFAMPMATASLHNLQKGKNNACRKSMAKRRRLVMRSTMVPPPRGANPDQVFVNANALQRLGSPSLVVVKRDPTLRPNAFATFVPVPWDHEALGFHQSSLKGNNGDFDGDIGCTAAYKTPEAVSQLRLHSKGAISWTNPPEDTKWVPPPDCAVYFYLAVRHRAALGDEWFGRTLRSCFPRDMPARGFEKQDRVEDVPGVRPDSSRLSSLLRVVLDVYGEEEYRGCFRRILRFYEDACDRFALCHCQSELDEYAGWDCEIPEDFDARMRAFDEPPHYALAVAVKSGVLDSSEHVFRLCTRAVDSRGGYTAGLNLEDYLKTAGSGVANYMKSKELGTSGHLGGQASVTFQSVVVTDDRSGAASSGDTVVFESALEYLRPDQLLHPETVVALAQRTLSKP